ncbi:MAG TPA: TonB-dependent receptor [Candidatus Xenobia bacterium]|nr:TonB-dependent receptor [Candidatus Xenobia bacterium]
MDYQGEKNLLKLFLTGGGTNFELPNTEDEELEGRDATRRLRAQTAILSWQHIFPPRWLVATSAYERVVSDRLVGTSDPATPYGDGSRSTLTTGVKSDLTYARGGHTVKAGVNLALFRLRESFTFDERVHDDHHLATDVVLQPFHTVTDLSEFSFRGRDVGGQFSFYVQDHFSPFRNFTVDAGVRWDQLNLVESFAQVSPRVGVAYYVPRSRSVIHFAYDRLFTPPPLEWVVLASFLGNAPHDEED